MALRGYFLGSITVAGQDARLDVEGRMPGRDSLAVWDRAAVCGVLALGLRRHLKSVP